jgi:hypothetical protein
VSLLVVKPYLNATLSSDLVLGFYCSKLLKRDEVKVENYEGRMGILWLISARMNAV